MSVKLFTILDFNSPINRPKRFLRNVAACRADQSPGMVCGFVAVYKSHREAARFVTGYPLEVFEIDSESEPDGGFIPIESVLSVRSLK